MADYTKLHFAFDELPMLTTPWKQLGTRAVALGLIRIPAGEGYVFLHRHAEQEEVYVVLEGHGLLHVDGEDVPLERGDVVRVAPAAKRALRANDDEPLLALCAGAVPGGYPKDPNARYGIDDGIPLYDEPPPWAANDPRALAINAELKARMERSRARREGLAGD